MSLFGLFDIGKSAMFASKTALSIIGHNIANINTSGYNRQDVILNVTNPNDIGVGYIGRGVSVAGIKRYYDRFIHNQLIDQHQNMGRSLALNKSLVGIEFAFNEAKDMGIASSLMGYINAWQDLITNPDSRLHRLTLINRADILVNASKRLENEITGNLNNIDKSIEDLINRINDIASKIAELNKGIIQLEAGSETKKANDLRDQRDLYINELSGLVDIKYFEDSSGSVTVTIGMRNLVEGVSANILSADIAEDGYRYIYLDNINITGKISKGELGGLLSVKKDIESNPLYRIRKLIASITKEVNLIHRAGYGLDGSTSNDFFNELQLSVRNLSSSANISATISDLSQVTLDEYEVRFDSSNNYYIYNIQTGDIVTSGTYVSGSTISFDGIDLSISGSVSEQDRFIVSPLSNAIRNFGIAINDPDKIAAATSDSTLPGDNNNAINILNLFDGSINDLDNSTFIDYYKNIVEEVAMMSRASSDSLTFDENLLQEIQKRRESLSGVSLDEEAANLVRYQRSFEAAARMIKITDELLETILNL